MVDLGLTDAQMIDLVGKQFGSLIRRLRRLRAEYRDSKLTRIMVIEDDDTAKRLSNWNLTAGRLFADTDAKGKGYVKLVANGGNYDIQIWDTDTHNVNKIAQATNVAVGAVGTLVPQTGYLLAGTVKLLSGTNGYTSVIQLVFDARREFEFIFSGAEGDEEIATFKDGLKNEWLSRITDPITQTWRDFAAMVNTEWWRKRIVKLLDLKTAQASVLIDWDYIDNDSGRAIKRAKGILYEFAEMMNQNTGGSGAGHVGKNTTSVVSITPKSTNKGKLALTGKIVLKEHVISGKVRIRCETDVLGSETVSIENIFDEELPSGKSKMEGGKVGQVKRAWADGPLGIEITEIARDKSDGGVADEIGDTGNIFDNTSIAGENSSNTDDGVVYLLIKCTNLIGPEFTISIYKSETDRDNETNALDSAVVTGTGLEIVTLEGSGLTFTTEVDKDAAATQLPNLNDEDEIDFDIKPLKVGDEWIVVVKNNEESPVQTEMAKTWHYSLPSDNSPRVPNDYFHAAPVVIENP